MIKSKRIPFPASTPSKISIRSIGKQVSRLWSNLAYLEFRNIIRSKFEAAAIRYTYKYIFECNAFWLCSLLSGKNGKILGLVMMSNAFVWSVEVACYIGIFQHYFNRLLGVNFVLRYRVTNIHSWKNDLQKYLPSSLILQI